MKLAISIGNTNINIGYFEDNELKAFRIRDGEFVIDEITSLLDNIKLCIDKVVILSVVSDKQKKIAHFLVEYLKVQIDVINIDDTLNDFSSYYKNQLGLDRKFAMEAISKIYKYNSFIFIDLGTATTINVILDNKFMGGIILPGIEIQYISLAQQTTLNLQMPNTTKMINLLGLNTVDNIDSGILNGQSILLEGCVTRIKEEFKKDFKVVYTGGNARFLHKYLSATYLYNENLIIEGILKTN